MKLISGSLVLRRGVGTQILMVSSSRTAEKSVVARNLPDSTSGARTALGISPIYESPALTRRTFSSLISMPVTVNPARANSTARGSPTYPSPTTPTRARRVRIFSAKICAVAPGKVSSADSVIEPIFSHSARARGGSRSEADWSRRFLLGEFLTHAGKAPFEQAAARTHAEIGEVDALGGVVHATGASRLDARPDGGQGMHPLHQIRPLRDSTVTGNHDIEIILEHLLDGGVPFLDAAAVGGVAERCTGCDEEVAGVQRALGREVDYGVAVGVAAPEILGHYLFAAEEDLLLVAKGEMGQAGLIPGHHVGAGVFG